MSQFRYNDRANEKLIEALVIDGNYYLSIIYDEGIRPDRFTFGNEDHIKIFEAAEHLYKTGEIVIQASIADELERSQVKLKNPRLLDDFGQADQILLSELQHHIQQVIRHREINWDIAEETKYLQDISKSNGDLNQIRRRRAESLNERAQVTGDKSPWQLKTLAQALVPLPPRVFVVDRLFARPSLSIVYGDPGSLKTMAMLDLALSVATGQGWLQGRPGGDPVAPFPVEQCPVIWFDQDSGER